MITVSRLNSKKFILNCELIKYIEAIPDTLITLTSGEKLMVKESVEHVIEETMNFRKRLYQEKPTPSKE
jgi:flagellar protein FlbD